MGDPKNALTLVFEPFTSDGETGIEVVDPIERHRCALSTPALVEPDPADEGQFRFPVDAAATIRTDAIALPNVVLAHVRDDAGQALARVEQFDHQELAAGSYTIELHAPIKLFLRVESALTVRADFERTIIEFDDPTPVVIGARSYHECPAAAVTTTTDPGDVMAAISTFGSALKTTSPERAYPTLRGHPPAIELGDELDIPAGLAPPDTDIMIELPPELRFIYPAAPLAYYLGASLVPGDTPRLRTDDGFEHALSRSGPGGRQGFEREVERVLKQTFFLDCLSRTEGLYSIDLHERHAFEADTDLDADLDFAALYDASPGGRLAAYLDMPFAAVEGHLPEWTLTSRVEAVPTSVETLPFVVDDLAVVRTAGPEDLEPVSPMRACAFDTVAATASEGSADDDSVSTFTRGGSSRSASTEGATTDVQSPLSTDELYVQPTATDSREQTWIGDGAPIGSSKATTAAYHNRLDRTPNPGDISITLICNDPEMNNEQGLVDDIYGNRAALPFDVTLHRDLTCTGLREVLAAEGDYLHYIGHIDEDGFVCAGGQLDATTLDEVGVDAFLLNACHSYRQGMALIDAGAIGGIVTLNDLFNHGAMRMGRTLARLLNGGFPLRSALDIARGESFVGEQYLVIGDGGLAIAQSESGIPGLCEIERADEGFTVTYQTYPPGGQGMGGTVSPYLISDDKHHLSSSHPQAFTVTRDELDRFLSLEDEPVRVDGDLTWSSDVSVDEL